MKRRALLIAIGAWLAAAATRAFAQVPNLPRRIAFLHSGSLQANKAVFDVFVSGLKDLGYVEGRDILIEARWAEGRIDL